MEELIDIVRNAVSDFMAEKPNLLVLQAHEQSISHRIAVYLERRLDNDGLNVDCEYNKNLGEPKRIEIDGIDERSRGQCGCRICNNDAEIIERERAFRPDIIAHERNSNDHNTIAIEIKKGVFCPFDEAKLKALTGNGQGYNYTLGCFVYFLNNAPTFRWYTGGNRIEDEL